MCRGHLSALSPSLYALFLSVERGNRPEVDGRLLQVSVIFTICLLHFYNYIMLAFCFTNMILFVKLKVFVLNSSNVCPEGTGSEATLHNQ